MAPSVSCHQNPEDLAFAFDADADRQVASAVSDGAVLADLDHQTVEIRDRVDPLQRPGSPCLDVLEDRVGDAADRVPADLHAIEILQMAFDVTNAHPAGIEANDLLVQARQPPLVLADKLGLERAGPVSRVVDLDLAELGLDRLRG